MKLPRLALLVCICSSNALSFRGLNLDHLPPCRVAPLIAETGKNARLSIEGDTLRYSMIGVTLSAQVTCRHETELDRVGYVQFILEGTAKAIYGRSTLHIRFAKLPIIDTYESLLPWYAF